MNQFKVWVEVEEIDEHNDFVTEWSGLLDGGSVAVFDDLDDAIKFGNKIQDMAIEVAESVK